MLSRRGRLRQYREQLGQRSRVGDGLGFGPAMDGLNYRRILASGGAPDSGNLAFWIDLSDASYLWQNNDQTTQVAANNDPIGYTKRKDTNGGVDIVGATGSNRPVWLNPSSLALAAADGTSHPLGDTNTARSIGSSWSNAVTVYTVAKFANSSNMTVMQVAGSQAWVSGHQNHGILSFVPGGANTTFWAYVEDASGNNAHDTAGTFTPPVTNHFTAWWDGSTIKAYYHRTAGSGVSFSNSVTFTQYCVESIAQNLFNFNGQLGEVLVYKVAHDATTRALVWDYIEAKWSL